MEARGVPVPALATEPQFAQRLRERLEEEQLLDGCYRLQEVLGGRVALPVLEEKLSQLRLPQEMPCELVWIQDPIPSRAARRQTPAQKLRDELRRLLGESWSEELERDVPRAWQRHGDLVLLREDSFRAAPWEKLGPVLWETVASALGARRLARRGRVLPDGMRSPSVTLLLGQDGWVEHVDNGIRYMFDVTKCMFSPGNITEKLRVASLPCSGEVLVDLYAAAATSPAPRHWLFHAAIPGSCGSCLCPRLRVEQPCCGGPAEELGAERCAGPLPCPPRGQQAAGAAGRSGPGESGADSQLGGRLAGGLPRPEEGHRWGSPHPPQCGDSPHTSSAADLGPAG
ncbi:tRNA wybutosine-synthesizing protein 2 homolog isoform X2 [Phalacrocorax carbo]|uniref:tRNA wybutosine-synthesizing protein 2 homolog isoform X2 n=1 Tax=Phalacrocorax carbo TaxID=9209 RepID=UPI0031198253